MMPTRDTIEPGVPTRGLGSGSVGPELYLKLKTREWKHRLHLKASTCVFNFEKLTSNLVAVVAADWKNAVLVLTSLEEK